MRFMIRRKPTDRESSALAGAPARAPRTTAFEPIRVEETCWRASSFDLAHGLDVKEMQSKLSAETLGRLFGS